MTPAQALAVALHKDGIECSGFDLAGTTNSHDVHVHLEAAQDILDELPPGWHLVETPRGWDEEYAEAWGPK